MYRRPALSLFASLILFAAAAAQAIPDCELNPDAPICNPDPDPDPDPCEIDPASCEPDPDPCEVDPASCEPDPDPAPQPDPEPDPLPEQEIYTHGAKLAGSVLVKRAGQKERTSSEFYFLMNEDHFALLFDRDGIRGALAPKGKKGKKFQLFLDDASVDLFAEFVMEQAGLDPAAANVLGETSKLVLTLRDDQTALLKIKSQLLTEGAGEMVFKARLAGAIAPVVMSAVPAGAAEPE